MKNKFHKIIFLSILILGAALRGQELISGNFLFLIDQGRDMMAVKNIVFDHHLTLIGPYTSLQGVFQGPLWYYLLSIPVVITGGNPWGNIALMFIISMSVLIVVYFFINRLFGKKTAIFTLFLFAISPEAVAASTYSWNPHPMWLLIVFYIFSFHHLIFKNSKYHLVLWPLIALMFHFETALAVVILLSTLIYMLIFNKEFIKQKEIILGIIFAFLLFLPQILFDLRHDFLMTKSVLNIFAGSKQGLLVEGESQNLQILLDNHLSLFFYNFETSFIRDGYLKYFPNIAILITTLVLLFNKRFNFFNNKENIFIIFMIRIVSIIIFISLFYPFPIRYWFLTGFQSFYLIFFGLIFSKIWSNNFGRIFNSLIIIIFLFYVGLRLDILYVHPVDEGGVAKIKGKMEAIDSIYKNAKNNSFNLLIFTPPVNTDAYDYLLWWYGKQKYSYIPSSEKKGMYYLLIEPDPEKPWSYKGWLETVIKTGKIVETKELPSGFIIQKRIEENEK